MKPHPLVSLATALLTALAPFASAENKQTDTHSLIRLLLDQDLGIRKFPFADVVYASSGHRVIAVDTGNVAHQAIRKAIDQAAAEAIVELSSPRSPIRKLRRINEASRYFEDLLMKKINTSPKLSCSIPKNTQGKEQRSGYPDLLITHTAPNGQTTPRLPRSQTLRKKNPELHLFAPSTSNHANEP